MKILLQSFSFKEKTNWTNLGLLYLQSVLLSRRDLAAEVEIKVLHSDVFDEIEDVYRQIEDFAPDILGLSAYVWSVESMAGLIASCARLTKRPILLCGGKGFAHIEREFMESNPAVDVIARGAGESTFIELVEHYLRVPERPRDLAHVQGIHFRDAAGEIRENPNRLKNMPLAAIPSPYLSGCYRPEGYLIMETERYCPFRCSYCSWADYDKKSIDLQLPLELIEKELDWANRNGCAEIEFIDSAINYNTERFIALLDLLDRVGGPPSRHYFFFLKFDIIDERQLQRLLTLKMDSLIFLGVESFSPEALRLVGRPNRIHMLKPLLDALATNPHIRLMAGLVLGLPGDDIQSFFRGVAFLHHYSNLHIRISLLSLSHGTAMRRQAETYGIRFQERGIPYLIESTAFPKETLRYAHEKIAAMNALKGRVSLNTLQVPYRRIMNPEIIPEALRQTLTPDTWLAVSVTRLENGYVQAEAVYPNLSF